MILGHFIRLHKKLLVSFLTFYDTGDLEIILDRTKNMNTRLEDSSPKEVMNSNFLVLER